MPFGSKKGSDADLDSQKSSLFGRKSSKPSKSAAPTNNPYAVAAPANDPYAAQGANPYATPANANDPYARPQSSVSQPPTSSFGSLSLNGGSSYQGGHNGAPQPNRYEKSPVPPNGYGGEQSRSNGYGNPQVASAGDSRAQASYQSGGSYSSSRYQSQGSYGQGSGYGGDAYGNAPPPQYSRKGGYGGMGRNDSQDTLTTDAGRSALFGDAPQRAAQQPADGQPYGGAGGDSSYTNSGGYGAEGLPGGYGAPAPDRELTAEEQEEEDIAATKQEIRFIKQKDVSNTRNARRIAEESEQIGRETLARLGAQGERIHNTERSLDQASNQNILAEEKARELKTLNRSMFAVHVANPFTAKKRADAADAIALEKNQRERDVRTATQAAAYSSQARQEQQQRDLNGRIIPKPGTRNLADRAKYQFEADSEDDEMEDEIEDNL